MAANHEFFFYFLWLQWIIFLMKKFLDSFSIYVKKRKSFMMENDIEFHVFIYIFQCWCVSIWRIISHYCKWMFLKKWNILRHHWRRCLCYKVKYLRIRANFRTAQFLHSKSRLHSREKNSSNFPLFFLIRQTLRFMSS